MEIIMHICDNCGCTCYCDMDNYDDPDDCSHVCDACSYCEEVNDAEDDAEGGLPTVAEFSGSDPNLTGGLSTDEYIRSIRRG